MNGCLSIGFGLRFGCRSRINIQVASAISVTVCYRARVDDESAQIKSDAVVLSAPDSVCGSTPLSRVDDHAGKHRYHLKLFLA